MIHVEGIVEIDIYHLASIIVVFETGRSCPRMLSHGGRGFLWASVYWYNTVIASHKTVIKYNGKMINCWW